MRSIIIALSLGTIAATVAYAHTGEDAPPAGQAGTLTCETLANVGLVFGRARVAACTFVSDDGDFTQAYGAILPPRADAAEAGSERLAWRVVTTGGTSRPGMLDGRFTATATATLRGRSAALEPAAGTGEVQVTLAASDARTELGALAPASGR